MQPRVLRTLHHKGSTQAVEWAGLNKGRDITVVRIQNDLFRIRIQEEETTKNMLALFKGSLTRDFRLQVFFINQCPSGPCSIPLGPFQIFSKIRGDIRE